MGILTYFEHLNFMEKAKCDRIFWPHFLKFKFKRVLYDINELRSFATVGGFSICIVHGSYKG